MSKTGVISASLRTELQSTQAANSRPKPNDGFVDVHDFVFGDGENLASHKAPEADACDSGQLQIPESGWPIFRYGRSELEVKKQADGEPVNVSLETWALRHRFTQPGTHSPFGGYTYAEQAPPDETVP